MIKQVLTTNNVKIHNCDIFAVKKINHPRYTTVITQFNKNKIKNEKIEVSYILYVYIFMLIDLLQLYCNFRHL